MESRSTGRPVPQWLAEYFDRVGSNLMQILSSGNLPEEVAPAVAEALEMKAPDQSGRRNVFKDCGERIGHEFERLGAVFSYIHDGYKFGQAVEAVASNHGIGKTTVTRAWNKHFRGLRPLKKNS